MELVNMKGCFGIVLLCLLVGNISSKPCDTSVTRFRDFDGKFNTHAKPIHTFTVDTVDVCSRKCKESSQPCFAFNYNIKTKRCLIYSSPLDTALSHYIDTDGSENWQISSKCEQAAAAQSQHAAVQSQHEAATIIKSQNNEQNIQSQSQAQGHASNMGSNMAPNFAHVAPNTGPNVEPTLSPEIITGSTEYISTMEPANDCVPGWGLLYPVLIACAVILLIILVIIAACCIHKHCEKKRKQGYKPFQSGPSRTS